MRLNNVTFEKRSVLDTGLASESYDLIYCTGVLHHIANTYAGLGELTRLLRPGGKILISLYNAVAFAPRNLRRRITRRLGDEDLDRRVQWGRRLFPITTRRLTKATRNDHESGLYDYFAIPYESYHTIGQVLKWFDQLGLEYGGSFPPAAIRDYPAMLAHPSFQKVEKRFRGPHVRLAARLSRGGQLQQTRPNFVSRAMIQFIWLVTGTGMWCIAARKPTTRRSQAADPRPSI